MFRQTLNIFLTLSFIKINFKFMLNITKKICKNWGERKGYKPEIIVIHISAGSMTSMTSWFNTPNSSASSHYGVGKDGSILQYVEEDKAAWTCGRVNNPSFKLYKPGVNPNVYTINIENEGQDLSKAPEIQLHVLAHLVKEIATRYNIPLDRDHVIGHYEIDIVNRPYCPSVDHSIMEKLMDVVYNIDSSTTEFINSPITTMVTNTTGEYLTKLLTNNRFKSFYWRTGMMVLAVILQQLTLFTAGLELSPTTTVLIGLILGEISKSINKTIKELPII